MSGSNLWKMADQWPPNEMGDEKMSFKASWKGNLLEGVLFGFPFSISIFWTQLYMKGENSNTVASCGFLPPVSSAARTACDILIYEMHVFFNDSHPFLNKDFMHSGNIFHWVFKRLNILLNLLASDHRPLRAGMAKIRSGGQFRPSRVFGKCVFIAFTDFPTEKDLPHCHSCYTKAIISYNY